MRRWLRLLVPAWHAEQEPTHVMDAEAVHEIRSRCLARHGDGCHVCSSFIYPHEEWSVWRQWLWLRWDEAEACTPIGSGAPYRA